MNKYIRTKEEINHDFELEINELKENIDIAKSLDPLDSKRERKILNLALSLRKLIFDSNTMTSLLTQKGIKQKLLFLPICTFSKSDYPGNILPQYPLLVSKCDSGKFYCEAIFNNSKSGLRFNIDGWLNEVVIDPKGEQKEKPTRKDIIRVLADKEGGAHYDAEHDSTYFDIKSNYAYEMIDRQGNVINLMNNIYFESLLSIANEFLRSISEWRLIGSEGEVSHKENNLLLIEIRYKSIFNNKEKFMSKYVHNGFNDIVRCAEYSFDSNGVADYFLIETKRISYFIPMMNTLISYEVIQDTNKKPLLFFVNSKEMRMNIAIKVKSKYYDYNNQIGYKTIESYNNYTLNQINKYFSHSNDLFFYKFSLERQYIGIEYLYSLKNITES